MLETLSYSENKQLDWYLLLPQTTQLQEATFQTTHAIVLPKAWLIGYVMNCTNVTQAMHVANTTANHNYAPSDVDGV